MEELEIIDLTFNSIKWEILLPLFLIILDILTGIVKAWKNNNFKSSAMRSGLSKKFAEIIYILIGILIKFAFDSDILLIFLVSYISLMEISSLFENCEALGLPIPKKLKEKLNNEESEKDD